MAPKAPDFPALEPLEPEEDRHAATLTRVLRLLPALGLLTAIVALAGCGGGSSASKDAQSCFTKRGFDVVNKPDLGATNVGGTDWFSATKNGSQVDVAFFPSPAAARAARTKLAAITKAAGKAVHVPVTDKQLAAQIRTNGSVLYWWTGTPANVAAVAACTLTR